MITVITKGRSNTKFVMVDQFEDNSIEALRYNDVENFGETQYTIGRWQPKGYKNEHTGSSTQA